MIPSLNIFSVYPTSKKSLIEKQNLANTCFIYSRTFCFNIINFSCHCVLQHDLAVLICLLCMFIFYWFILSSLSVFPLLLFMSRVYLI